MSKPAALTNISFGLMVAVAALGLLVGLILTDSDPASAATTIINPSKDNTLYEYFAADGDRSNGAGTRFFAGRTDQGRLRRGVLAFPVGSIPAGSTITSVSLSMSMSRTNLNTSRIIELHKLLADWGEGTSNASGNEGEERPPPPTMPLGVTASTTVRSGPRKAAIFPVR